MKMFVTRVRVLCLSLVAVLAGVFAVQGEAQDPGLKPTFGSIDLKADFTPDPHSVKVIAGGTIKTNLGGVNAFVAKEPDFSLNYTAGNLPLTIHVESAADTTLLINTPDGKWVANDDRNPPKDLNPLVRFDKPQSGRYDIFVGTIGEKGAPGVLFITELPVGAGKAPPKEANVPDPNLDPAFGSVKLTAGFTPDPFEKKVTAGGPIVSIVGNTKGAVSQAPTFRLEYTAGKFPLTFHVAGADPKIDTTLLIRLPDGKWLADDDSGGGLNPLIKLNEPQSGRYDIYVGMFGKVQEQATLFITETK